MSQKKALRALSKAGNGVDEALKKILAKYQRGSAASMYKMLGYFFGFLDENLKREKGAASGKRFRPSLCLLIADGYGSRKKAFDAALAIELFHNFTLIHDDIEDRDELRRGKPTLWKLFGVNHAINSGDALSLITSEMCANAEPRLRKSLFAAFREVLEGQYMDFELATERIGSNAVNKKNCITMTEKKTGALVGVACEAAGIAAGKNSAECKRLRTYGRTLGIAFQLADDCRSVWSTQKETGKDTYGDIREHKRTLPFFFAYEETSKKARLAKLYSLDRQLSKKEIDEVRKIIDATSAQERMREEIQTYADKARKAAKSLSLKKDTRPAIGGARGILAELVDALIPEATKRA